MAQKNKIGVWVPVDSKSPTIKHISAWAVKDYNEDHGENLKFEEAFEAEEQEVIGGVNFRIGLWASSVDGSMVKKKRYEALVYRNLDDGKALISLKPFLQEKQRMLHAYAN
ncbi:unnamed protein product [Amaranthus hypochondriacus]